MNSKIFAFLNAILAGLCVLISAGCGSSSSSSSSEDDSTSGSAASALGGGINGSSSSGTMSQNQADPLRLEGFLAWASPFYAANASTSCTAFSNSLIGTTVTYSDCSFSGSSAVWSGSASFSGTAGSSVTRLITNGTTRTASGGTVVTINTSGSNLTPFNSDTAPSGGSTATLTSGAVTGIAINGINYDAASSTGTTLFKHIVTTSSSDGGTALTYSSSTGLWSGTIIIYHQIAKVKATAKVSVGMTAGCCLPTSGSISTSFDTSASGALAKYDNATESLSFTGCGTATYTGPEGNSGSVTLVHCL